MDSINVVFLDFDGVVNTCMWYENSGKLLTKYNWPEHGSVNNWQACQWLSKFCKERGYSIVVSSSWRKSGLENCKKCLYNGGVWESVHIIDRTPVLNTKRGYEIQKWLDVQREKGVKIKRWIIIDDEDDMVSKEQFDRLVLCRGDAGFLLNDMKEAERIHEAQKYSQA
jgi:hypothetical protein